MGFTVTIPVPPSINDAYGVNPKTGRRYLKPHVRQWKRDAGFIVISQRPKAITGPYKFWLNVPKTRKDNDNMIKFSQDLLVSLRLTPDDKHCVNSSVSIVPELDGYATVSVEEVV
jgi:Holliday junction resolvase RusA-like endonuclease